MKKALGWVAAALLAFIVGAHAALPANGAEKKPKHGAVTAAGISGIPGICDTANVTDLFSDLTDESKKRDQIDLIQGRILECSRNIRAALATLPSPAPTPYWVSAAQLPAPMRSPAPDCVSPPAATERSRPIELYETLGLCANYWTYLTGRETPEPVSSPLPSVASRPTFYVFATGGVDPAAAAVLVRSLGALLQKTQAKAGNDALQIVARSDWTEAGAYASQCQQDPNTRGALIVETSIPSIYRLNYLLLVANFIDVSASVELLSCGPEDHTLTASPLSIWNQQAITGKAHQDTMTLGIFSALIPILYPSKTVTNVTAGGGGGVNVSSTETQTPAFSGSLQSEFDSQSLQFPAQNGSVQLQVASERFANRTMSLLNAVCFAPGVRKLASEADPANVPVPPREHRTLAYRAAFELIGTCSRFANFSIDR